MARKAHNGIIHQRIVVFIFIFLNCLFTAAPLIQAAGFNHSINPTALSLQNQNDSETSHLSQLDDEQQECHIAWRNKRILSKAHHLLRDDRVANGNENPGMLHYANDYLLIRPRYYSFLSIYYLF
jgi:hypothetical protein